MAAKSAKTLMMAATHTPSMGSPRTRRRFMARSPRLAYLCTYGTWLIETLTGDGKWQDTWVSKILLEFAPV